ncbi:hypothetical protein [Phaeobacter sp. HF9A]|uniref:Cas10/Cmr2 second palm domain-containing protein n=1 Tax=Phaeobacter sp. HF9A TaxID=2721561 RepID=UPI00143111E3|nr:hypothetical protein [Phaeobacter sp. HF9A]NIZ11935.1 hypothetical protein [Phaeobacter sp. HF9A]
MLDALIEEIFMEKLGLTYFKCAPYAFGQTVYDTGDLSITRGASLTLLAAPAKLQDHLASAFPAFDFRWIQSSASELLWSASKREERTELTIKGQAIKPPKSIKKAKWNKALQQAAETAKHALSDASLRDAARSVISTLMLGGEADVENIAGQILYKCGDQNARAPSLDPAQCEAICDAVRGFLSSPQQDWPFDLMLFNVAWHCPTGPKQTSPRAIIAALDTALGRSQLQRLSCIVPALTTELNGHRTESVVCAYTGLHAADAKHSEKGRPTSITAKRRRIVGTREKPKFYGDVLEHARVAATSLREDWRTLPAVKAALEQIEQATESAKAEPLRFASDFQDLVHAPPPGLPISLRSNICVLNMDGNSFGKLRLNVRDMEEYRALSNYLDILKAGLLAQILTWIRADKEMRDASGALARFETLLWGGDEFTFVLPAWKGWELAQEIHAAVKKWQTPDGEELTFATGLAFGPHNAPIRDLKAAAEQLADHAKEAKPNAAWQAIAYEGVDRIHFLPDQFRADWLGGVVETKAFCLGAEEACALPGVVEKMLSGLRRSGLHQIYYKYCQNIARVNANNTDIVEKILADIDRTAPAIPDVELNAIKDGLFPEHTARPLVKFAQIALLLDYIQPRAHLT